MLALVAAVVLQAPSKPFFVPKQDLVFAWRTIHRLEHAHFLSVRRGCNTSPAEQERNVYETTCYAYQSAMAVLHAPTDPKVDANRREIAREELPHTIRIVRSLKPELRHLGANPADILGKLKKLSATSGIGNKIAPQRGASVSLVKIA